jgi:arylsulfatase A-like enzyme
VDDQIRRLLNPVDGVDSMTGGNTIVVLTSDHGEMLGDHYMWRKSVPYEGSARIPLLIRAPARFGLRARSVVDAPVCLEDIMPTLLEMAGADIPRTVEGRSLLPLMRGEKPDWRPHLHIEHAPLHHTLTDGREKYIWHAGDGREQLFDLASDPTECHDLAARPEASGRVARWRSRLIEELDDRPEGFTDGKRLIAGRPYGAVMPHAEPKREA